MHSVKTINNQNAITSAVLGLDSNSNTIVNGNLTIQDASGSYVITPSGAIPSTNTTFNNISVNGTMTQNNTGTNINQTDHTVNAVGNTLRATQIYGDLNLRRPTTENGGSLSLYDTGGTTNYFMQISQSGAGAGMSSTARDGFLAWSQYNTGNISRPLIRAQPSAGVYVQGWQTDNGGSLFKVAEMVSGKAISFIPGSTSGILNPLVQNGDNQIICSEGAAQNGAVLVAGIWSNVCNGLKVNGPAGTTSIAHGGVGGNPTTSFSCNGTNSTINGPAIFSSTTPPTSAQTIPASNDSSTIIPTTAWVQSAISGGSLSPMPYYQAYYFLNAPLNFDRYATFQFNFTGTNWGINDYFSISFRCSLVTTTANTSNAPNYATFNTIIDIYPARCPANNTNPSAYGVNPTQPNTTNFSLLNGSIYNGGLQSAYVLTSNGLPYAPYGRWYWSNNYTIWTSGTAYPTTSPAPIAPYIQYGTAEKSAFGFGLWGASITYSYFSINMQVVNRGPNGTGQGITLTSNYTLGGGTGNTLNEVKVGL